MKVTTRVPLDIGAIHFIGIGGIGMSGIAEIMHNLGYKVQGSDVSESANVKRLKAMGIAVAIGHSADNLKDAHAVVYSSAVKPGNVEFDAARALSLPLVRRAEMLAEIMRLRSCVAIAGTNGKTTTTTLVAALLDGGGMDPTVVNGGIINAYGTNARLGAGEWVVVEADESDGTFLRLPATIAVVTNADPDHLDFYGTFDAMRGGLPALHRECAFLWFRGAVPGSSRSPGDGGPHHRPPHDHLWLFAPGRCPRHQCALRRRRLAFRCRFHRPPQE